MAPGARSTLSKQLESDIKQRLTDAIKGNPSLTPDAAMVQVTQDMLKNNPYVPPKGCPVNDIPPELLAYIFRVGVEMEVEGSEEDWVEEEDMLDMEDEWTTDEDTDSDSDVMMPGSFGAKKSGKSKAMDVDDAFMEGVGPDESESEDEEDSEDSREHTLPFQVLVSHVCKRWRQVAIDSPILWTALEFNEPAPYDRARIWIERAKESPLDIRINATMEDEESEPFTPGEENNEDERPSDHPPITAEQHGQVYAEEHSGCRHAPPRMTIQDIEQIFDLIIPVVSQWRTLEVACSIYDYMHAALKRLSECPGAPMLEALELYHYEDTEDYETFVPRALSTNFSILSNYAPKLKDVALWGVHLDWDRSISLLSGIRDLELAYHAKDVRPSFATFSQIVAQSPQIRTLTLCLSGPAEHDDENNDWGREPLEIPSLQDLVLCYHDLKYAIAFVKKLSVPNVRSLALDYDDEEFTDFIKTLTTPAPGKTKSLLSGLEHLKIAGLHCNNSTIEAMFGQLNGLQTINLNCSTDDVERIFNLLEKSSNKGLKASVYCPNLQMLTTTGIDGARMRSFVEDRKKVGLPLKKVMMSEDDEMEEKDERWLRANLEDLEYFEPSDSEEELFDDEIEDEDGMILDEE